MKYLVTANEMKNADLYTSEEIGIPSLVLMERAAVSVVEEIGRRFLTDSKIAIICGNGNNGGDGYAIGRILIEKGYEVDIFAAKQSAHQSEANIVQQNILQNLQIQISTERPNNEYDIVVDAIFGTGLNRELSDYYLEYMTYLNSLDAFKIAVDIPSGINSDTGAVMGEAFLADLTVTFGFYKKGHYLYPGKGYCKKTICKEIGITEKAFHNQFPKCRMLEKEDFISILPKRTADSHKGTYKRAGLIAGNKQMGGAAILASKAAMKSGVGYVKTLTDADNRDALLKHIPECLIYTYDKNNVSDLSDCACVAIGPGIGTDSEARIILSNALQILKCPLIIDADAINLISAHDDLYSALVSYSSQYSVIMTPHKKELERMYHQPLPTDQDMLYKAEQEIATQYHVYLVCKGAATRIYSPDGECFINASGNNGMATAGSGDVLTGILAGIIAQCDVNLLSVALCVYIHGLCGDCANDLSNQRAIIASDFADALNLVLKENS